MGAVRKSGIITESTAAPYAPIRAGNIHSTMNSAGHGRSLQIGVNRYVTLASNYVRRDDGGVFTSYDNEADSAGANDVFPMTAGAGEAVNDACYYGSSVPFSFIKVLVGTQGAGNAITWEYYNGAWVALSVTDTDGLYTAAAGLHEVTWTAPADWVAVAVNATTAYWVRARITAANFTTTPLFTRVWCGYPDKATLICDHCRRDRNENSDRDRERRKLWNIRLIYK